MDIQATNIPAVDDSGPDVAGLALPPDAGVQHCLQLLVDAGLRPTRQRLALGRLLFLRGHRHVTAESLFEEAMAVNAYRVGRRDAADRVADACLDLVR